MAHSILTVGIPEYHALRSRKPRSIQALADMIDHPIGLWEVIRFNRHGDELSRLWGKNVLTDIGATAMLKNAFASAGAAVNPFNFMYIDTSGASTTLTIATGVGATTVLNVSALPSGSPTSGLQNLQQIVIGYGGGTTQTLTVNGAVAQGATTITVNSFTPSINYPIGTNVVPLGLTNDNPASLGGTVYISTALTGGAYSYSGAGAGLRQVSVVFTFAASTGLAGGYTEAWMANAGAAASGIWGAHLFMPSQAINGSSSAQVTVIEKI